MGNTTSTTSENEQREALTESKLFSIIKSKSEQIPLLSFREGDPQLKQQYLKILHLSEEEGKDFYEVKRAYRKKMIQVNEIRFERIDLNLSYLCAIENIENKTPTQLEIAIALGKSQQVKQILKKNPQMLDAKIRGEYPPLYHAVRSGHDDIVVMILEMGCSIDFKEHKSSPMHCAAFYGHKKIIPILVDWGISLKLLNKSGNLPIDQAATDEIYDLFKFAEKDRIKELYNKVKTPKSKCTQKLQNGELVIKKIILNPDFNDQNYEDAFHGTSFQFLQSISKYGMRKNGDIVGGHYIEVVNETTFNSTLTQEQIQNWQDAAFASPSIYYAREYARDEDLISQSIIWLSIVHVKVRKDSFKKYGSVLQQYKLREGEPEELEWRIEDCSNIEVVSFIFVKKGYLEKCQNYSSTVNLFLSL